MIQFCWHEGRLNQISSKLGHMEQLMTKISFNKNKRILCSDGGLLYFLKV